MKLNTRNFLPLGLLGLGAVGAHAADIVPAADASFTPTGTLLAITSTIRVGGNLVANSPEFTASSVGGTPNNVGVYWAPNGTPVGDGAAIFTVATNAVHTFTFSAADLPDGAIIHGVYVRWRAQGNQSNSVDYSYAEGTDTGTINLSHTANEVGPSFSWTTSAATKYTLGFQTLFSDDIVVTGGDGFTLTIANNSALSTNGNVIRTNALIIDYSPIPEPSSPYGTWATGGELFNDDSNGDGVDNGLAWFLGASGPGVSALDKLPVVTTPTGYLQLDFTRQNPQAPAKLYVEYGDDLNGWTKLEIPAVTGTIGGDIEVTVTAGPPDAIKIKIPDSHAVGGKLFARLSATEN